MNEFVINFEWEPVMSGSNVRYSFPDQISKFLKSNSSGPAVYRWSVMHRDKIVRVYYGEAENLSRRTDGYRRGHVGQQTNARIKLHFVDLLSKGHAVSLHRLRLTPFLLNGVLIDEKSLCRKEVRCFLENALMVTVPAGVELLNKASSTEAKEKKKAMGVLEALSPASSASVVQALRNYVREGKR